MTYLSCGQDTLARLGRADAIFMHFPVSGCQYTAVTHAAFRFHYSRRSLQVPPRPVRPFASTSVTFILATHLRRRVGTQLHFPVPVYTGDDGDAPCLAADNRPTGDSARKRPTFGVGVSPSLRDSSGTHRTYILC